MSSYRLHIDIPLTMSEIDSVNISKLVVGMFIDKKTEECLKHLGIKEVNYRLGNDDDRQRSNYLDINENGHCSNKKSRVPLG